MGFYKKNRDWSENLTIVMQLGLTMAGSIIFCFAVGWYIDKWLGTRGIFVTIFILLGVVGGGNVAYRQIMEITEQGREEDDPDEPDEPEEEDDDPVTRQKESDQTDGTP